MEQEDIKLLANITGKLDYFIDRLNIIITLRDDDYVEKHNIKELRNDLRDLMHSTRRTIINWNK